MSSKLFKDNFDCRTLWLQVLKSGQILSKRCSSNGYFFERRIFFKSRNIFNQILVKVQPPAAFQVRKQRLDGFKFVFRQIKTFGGQEAFFEVYTSQSSVRQIEIELGWHFQTMFEDVLASHVRVVTFSFRVELCQSIKFV